MTTFIKEIKINLKICLKIITVEERIINLNKEESIVLPCPES